MKCGRAVRGFEPHRYTVGSASVLYATASAAERQVRRGGGAQLLREALAEVPTGRAECKEVGAALPCPQQGRWDLEKNATQMQAISWLLTRNVASSCGSIVQGFVVPHSSHSSITDTPGPSAWPSAPWNWLLGDDVTVSTRSKPRAHAAQQ